MIILGIDPGTATTGFGVIKKTGKKIEVIEHGCVETSPKSKVSERLAVINCEIKKIIKKHKPKALAIESLFFFKNLKTALPVSQAKGVILLAAQESGIPIFEFTPLQVKMAITGYGRAEKKQVQKMLQILLNLKELPKKDDASDALGVAFCYSLQEDGLNNLRKLSLS